LVNGGIIRVAGKKYPSGTPKLDEFKRRLAEVFPERALPVSVEYMEKLRLAFSQEVQQRADVLKAFYASNTERLPEGIELDLVSVILRGPRDITSEDKIHIYAFKLIEIPLTATLNALGVRHVQFMRNRSETIGSAPTTILQSRADFSVIVGNLLTLRGEEKMNGLPMVPIKELMQKTKWNPVFTGDLEFLVGYAWAGTYLALVALTQNKRGDADYCELKNYDLMHISSRAEVILDFMRVGHLLQAMSKATSESPITILGAEIKSLRNGRRVCVHRDHVTKHVESGDFKTVQKLFHQAKGARHVVQLKGEVERVNNGWKANLAPVGAKKEPSGPVELAHFVDNLLTGLADLHKLGVLHLDVRMDNVLWDPMCKEWFLIDVDEGLLLGTNGRSANVPHPARGGDSKAWTSEDDLEMVANLLASVLNRIDLAKIVRAAAGSAARAREKVLKVLHPALQATTTTTKSTTTSKAELLGKEVASGRKRKGTKQNAVTTTKKKKGARSRETSEEEEE